MINYRNDIDGLRALAVVPVVLFHAGIPGFGGGFVGVDIFFVISGYLITGIIAREIADGRFSIFRFYERRVRRIIPAYISVCIVAFLVGIWLLLPSDFSNMSMSIVASVFFVANMYFAGQMSYFQEAAEELPLLHLWSLAVEEQFYLVWPVVVIGMYKLINRKWYPWILSFMIIFGVALTEWAVHNKSPTMVFYYAPFRFFELMMGAFLALCPPAPLRSSLARWGMAVMALLLIAAPVALYRANSPPFPGVAALAPCLGAAIVIYLGLYQRSELAGFLGSAPLRGIGLISYSLYLWHWPIFAFTRVSTGRDPSLSEAVLLILASIAAAFLSWRFVEGPFRRSGPKTLLSGWKPAFKFAGTGLAALGVAGMFGFLTRGFPARAGSPAQQELVAEQVSPVYKRCLRNQDPELIAHAIPGCSWGRAHAPTKAVIWGDSHAAAYFQGMSAAAEQADHHLQILAMQSCAPLADQVQDDRGRAGVACDGFNKHVLQAIAEDEEVDVVFISGFWLDNVADLSTLVHDRPVSLAQSSVDEVQAALTLSVKMLSGHGKKVVLLPDVPFFPTGGGKCARQRLFMGRSPTECAVSRSFYQATTGRINHMLKSIAASVPNVTTYDVDEVFCRQEICTPTIAGAPAFIDKHHMNVRGAEAVIALASKQLAELTTSPLPGP